MFTGLVARKGRVLSRRGARLVLSAPGLEAGLGASVAVNGCCLTVAAASPGRLAFDAGPETFARTNLGALEPGAEVNLEPSLRAGGEIGGHFVTGHVDATAAVLLFEPWGEGGFMRLRLELPRELKGLVAAKGSIAVDGVSLTVASRAARAFEAMLVPVTLRQTTLGGLSRGRRVNLEADPLARYARQALAAAGRLS